MSIFDKIIGMHKSTTYGKATFSTAPLILPSGDISLTTVGAIPANTDLWCFSALGLNYQGGSPNYQLRDVLDPTLMQVISDLGAKALQYVGGAPVNIAQVVVGKTDWTLGGGYNCSDCAFGDGQCCPTVPFTQDFFLVMVELCRQL